MMKERKLLRAWLCVAPHIIDLAYEKLQEDTKELLAQPEKTEQTEQEDIRYGWRDAYEAGLRFAKREPLSDEEVIAKYRAIAVDNALYVPTYYAGFRDAEKAHGIGVDDE